MIRLLKSVLAEFSYFLEKYFGITSILWSLVFIALCCAVIEMTAVQAGIYGYEKKKKEKLEAETVKKRNIREYTFSIYAGLMLITTYIVNYLVTTSYTWNSKLQRVMSNFQYVLSFKTNRHAFLFALGLPDNEVNKKGLFKMALYLNKNQWNKVFDNAGEGAWYFEKVKKAIFQILHVGDCHLMLSPVQQGWIAYLPIAGLLILLFVFLRKGRKLDVVLAILACVFCLFASFGAGIFVLSALCFGLIWRWLLEKYVFVKQKENKKE